MAFRPADLNTLLLHTGVPVVLGAVSDRGLFRNGARLFPEDGGLELRSEEKSVTVIVDRFPGRQVGDAPVIDGVMYRIRDIEAVPEDGALERWILAGP